MPRCEVFLFCDEQTDIKTLLGAYVCGDTVGEFVWRPGVVTEALQHGKRGAKRVEMQVVICIYILLLLLLLFIYSICIYIHYYIYEVYSIYTYIYYMIWERMMRYLHRCVIWIHHHVGSHDIG